jgi:hypothetical protein
VNGYLQRLVETARAAKPAVYPIVPPMFSLARFETEQPETLPGKGMEFRGTTEPAGDVGVRMEALHPVPAREHHPPVKDALTQAHTEDQHAVQEPAMIPHGIGHSAAPDERITAYQPLLPPNREEPGANKSARRTPLANEPQPAAMDAPAPFAGVRPQTPPNVLSIEWPDTAEYPARRSYPSSLPAARMTSPVSPGVPDHIEIHIGRVEVTAVPAATIASAAKQTPKGPSLQEYLKHRERRPR